MIGLGNRVLEPCVMCKSFNGLHEMVTGHLAHRRDIRNRNAIFDFGFSAKTSVRESPPISIK